MNRYEIVWHPSGYHLRSADGRFVFLCRTLEELEAIQLAMTATVVEALGPALEVV